LAGGELRRGGAQPGLPDSVLRLRGAGRAFAAACGYALRWKNTVAPRAVATGAKRLDNNPASREHLRHALRRTGPA
jgi:hypothetical protein